VREPDDDTAGDAYATWAGPYVLGALSPADAQAFARHLPGCAACRAAVQDLAALPGLLSRVPASALDGSALDAAALDAAALDAAALDGTAAGGVARDGGPAPAGAGGGAADPGPVPDTLLPALLRSVRAQRRRRRLVGGVAAGLVAASVVTALVVGVDRSPVATPRALPSPSASSPSGGGEPGGGEPGGAAVLRPLLPTPLTITARLTGLDWGTEVDVTCAYAPAGTSPAFDYALVVTDRAGAVEQIGTWTAVPGSDVQLRSMTALPRAQIASVEVRTLDGMAIARLDPPAS